MLPLSLATVASEQITLARTADSGRSAKTIHGGSGRSLRQTVLALAAGRALGEHESPGEATLHVLQGRVRLTAGADAWEGAAGDYLVIPAQRHNLEALEDSAVLLTVVTPSRP